MVFQPQNVIVKSYVQVYLDFILKDYLCPLKWGVNKPLHKKSRILTSGFSYLYFNYQSVYI